VGVLKKEKLSLEVVHSKLLDDFASLDKAHNALKMDYTNLSKSSDQPQGEASKEKEVEVSFSTNPCCDHDEEIAALEKY
jgi:hypothetical protein